MNGNILSGGTLRGAFNAAPVISVIMPVYNAGGFLREAIDSILSQTFSNFELIIINDGSTDFSEDVIFSYSDSRIIYIKNDVNLRLIKTLNKGVAASRGEYIARMDADDVALPCRFEKQIAFLYATGVDVVSSAVLKINANGKMIGIGECLGCGEKESRFVMSLTNPINHPTVFAKKSAFEKFAYSDTLDASSVEDYELWSRMIDADLKFGILAEPLLLYRRAESNITTTHLDEILEKSADIAARIQIAVHGRRSSDDYISYFILRRPIRGFLGFRSSINCMYSMLSGYASRNSDVDVCVLKSWCDYLIVQMLVRLNASVFLKVVYAFNLPFVIVRVIVNRCALRFKIWRMIGGSQNA